MTRQAADTTLTLNQLRKLRVILAASRGMDHVMRDLTLSIVSPSEHNLQQKVQFQSPKFLPVKVLPQTYKPAGSNKKTHTGTFTL